MEIDAVRVEVVGRLDDVVAREHPRRRALRPLLLLTLAPAFLLLGLLLERRQALWKELIAFGCVPRWRS